MAHSQLGVAIRLVNVTCRLCPDFRLLYCNNSLRNAESGCEYKAEKSLLPKLAMPNHTYY